jgi:hypothetical protein
MRIGADKFLNKFFIETTLRTYIGFFHLSNYMCAWMLMNERVCMGCVQCIGTTKLRISGVSSALKIQIICSGMRFVHFDFLDRIIIIIIIIIINIIIIIYY